MFVRTEVICQRLLHLDEKSANVTTEILLTANTEMTYR